MISNYVVILKREIHYTEWGEKNEDIVLMWHGLFRTGRDFDVIARHLSDRFRVICPDVIGRGLSQWSPDPQIEYTIAHYAELARGLVDHLGARTLRWLGTSMGGLIGIQAASDTLKGRISHLILNDVGPAVNEAAVNNIRNYGSQTPSYDCVSEFESYIRTIYASWGALTDAEWRHIAEASFRRRSDGKITTHYDPAIVEMISRPDSVFDMWEQYDEIDAKTLCLRGGESELLLAEVADEMQRRGPKCQIATIPGVGHAPALSNEEQIAIVRNFLES